MPWILSAVAVQVRSQPALRAEGKPPAQLLHEAGITPPVGPQAGVEASLRNDGTKRILWLINHTEREEAIQVPQGKRELISGMTTASSLTLGAFGVAAVLF